MNSKENREKRIKWFTEARFGMFIHWGIYAIPARASRSEWIRSVDQVSDEDYQIYFDTFNPVNYNPREWARLAKEAGMKYAVLTTKHHDGFCLFDSKYTDFKSTNTPCGRDLVREYVDAFRAEGIKVGFYYSLLDWHHPDYPAFNDPFHPMRGNENYRHYGENFENYLDYMHNQVRELMTNYGKIDILWFDFHYNEMTEEKWRASDLIKMVREINPDVIIDDRLGGDIKAQDKPLYVGDFGSPEQMIPKYGLTDYQGAPIPWETCMTLNNCWGYSHDTNYKNAKNVINTLVECVSKGGNLILNVGPNALGEIPEQSVSVLKEVGEWMKLNGESIYSCTFSGLEKPEFGRITKNDDAYYLYIQDLTSEYIALYDIPHEIKFATLLCDGSKLSMSDPWNVESYLIEGHRATFVHTPLFKHLNGNGNVIKLLIKK